MNDDVQLLQLAEARGAERERKRIVEMLRGLAVERIEEQLGHLLPHGSTAAIRDALADLIAEGGKP